MSDESDDVATWRFQRVSALAVMGSALLHAVAIAALLPEGLPRQERLTEQAIELTLTSVEAATRALSQTVTHRFAVYDPRITRVSLFPARPTGGEYGGERLSGVVA